MISKQPLVEAEYRIALLGGTPNRQEQVLGSMFVSKEGQLLDRLLNRASLLRAACYVGSVADGDFATDLAAFNPHLCVLLGQEALAMSKSQPAKIDKWRGSVYLADYDSPLAGRKCLPTYDPAHMIRVYEDTPLALMDLKRARAHGCTSDYNPPQRDFDLHLCADEIIERFRAWKGQPIDVSTDLEGYWNNLTMISFSDHPSRGFIVPFVTGGGDHSHWDSYDERRIWLAMKDLMEDMTTPKTLQNGLYDAFVLAYGHGIVINNIAEDTMLKHSELYCELPKNLGVQTSIYSEEPFYKDERTDEDPVTRKLYCCKDSAVTLENSRRQDVMLAGLPLLHYQMNVALLEPLLYMEVRGIRFDVEKAKARALETRQRIYALQAHIDDFAMRGVTINDEADFIEAVRPLCMKRSWGYVNSVADLLPNAKKATYSAIKEAVALVDSGYPFDASRNGRLAMLTDNHLNVDSPKQMQDFLYGTLKWPIMTKRNSTGGRSPTADALALLRLYKGKSYKSYEHPILRTILEQRAMLTSLDTLEIEVDPDGRVRCGYNAVGTETHRLTCYKSPTGSGFNLQTATKDQRVNFLADPGHYIAQADLAGADGWTVAAHAARLGDQTMLNDYKRGLKPALIICLMYNGVKVSDLSEAELKQQHDDLKRFYKSTAGKKDAWLYDAAKRVQHGSNYMMQPFTMSDTILKVTYKESGTPLLVPPALCEQLQNLYFARYWGVKLWHRWVADEIRQKKQLVAASGSIRRIFGRTWDEQTIKSLLAHEPQHNTTYATNLAALKLWRDPLNRIGVYHGPNRDVSLSVVSQLADDATATYLADKASALHSRYGDRAMALPILEPLHQVHDALLTHFAVELSPLATARLPYYFDNPITIAGTTLTIPTEINYGPSWGEQDYAIC